MRQISLTEKLQRYKRFFNKTGNILLESKSWKTSRYMDFSEIYECQRTNDYCLNYRNNTFNLLRENERDVQYLHEASGIVQPYSQLESDFRCFCKEKLSPQLLKLSERDFGISSKTEPLVDDVEKQFEDENIDYQVFTIVSFRFPYYANADIKELLQDFIDCAEHDNYGLLKFGREQTIGMKQPIPGENLNIFFITFEAKYNNFQFSFSDDLYHFTSIDALPGINKCGLVPSSANPIFTYDKRVYLFNNIPVKDIFDFAIEKAECQSLQKFALLRVDSNKLFKWKDYVDGIAKFYVDTKVSSIRMSEARAIYTYEAIPRDLIEDDVAIFELNKWFRPIGKTIEYISDF